MTKCILTIDLKSKKGKYFVKTVLPVCRHVITVRPNELLIDGNWVDYVLDVDDYVKCEELLQRFES